MSTLAVNLINGTVRHLDSNSFFAPYTTINSGSTQNPQVLVMKSAVVSVIKGIVKIPDDCSSTPVIEIMWTSETTTNTVDFKFRHRVTAGSDLALLDISTTPTELEDPIANNGGPSASSEQMIDEISLTTTDFAAGAYMYYEFERDGVTDDKADDITVWGLELHVTGA